MRRRTYLKGVAAGSAVGTSALAGCTNVFGGGSDSITVGATIPVSGWAAFAGKISLSGVKLALDDVRSEGNIDQEITLKAPDTASDTQKAKTLAQQLILEDDVDVLLGDLSSAAREAQRPVVDDHKQLYFYYINYEGGLCDEYTYITGPAATQNTKPLVDYMVDEFGTDVYIVSADYNFGHISAQWAEYFLDQKGGSVIGKDFVPQNVSDFGSVINDIQEADPDWILTMLVSTPNLSFWKQADSVGLDKPMGSPNIVSVGFEQQRLSPPVLENMYFTTNYVEGLPGQANADFVDHWREQYPDTPYITLNGYGAYLATRLYFKAVEQTGTTDQQEIHTALENGLGFDVAGRTPAIDPATHNCAFDIALGRVKHDHSLEFLDTYSGVTPVQIPNEPCKLDGDGSTWDDPRTEQVTPEGNL